MVARRSQVQQQKEAQVEEVVEETQPEESKEVDDQELVESQNDEQNDINECDANECNNSTEKQNLESNISKEENASQTSKSAPLDYKNDCAAVIQHLNKMRLTCGPLKLQDIHNPELISILENASNYQINMSSIQNKDENGNIIGTDHISMLEISFFDRKIAEKMKEELEIYFSNKNFDDTQQNKIEVNFWNSERLYNYDLSHMNFSKSDQYDQFKRNLHSTNFFQPHDQWLCIRNLPNAVLEDEIKEKVKNIFYIFKTDDETRAYFLMENENATKESTGKSVQFKDHSKNFRVQALASHPLLRQLNQTQHYHQYSRNHNQPQNHQRFGGNRYNQGYTNIGYSYQNNPMPPVHHGNHSNYHYGNQSMYQNQPYSNTYPRRNFNNGYNSAPTYQDKRMKY
ncbi:MAG: hypothetical protein MHPSP_002573 [Paramarteilia canceri]